MASTPEQPWTVLKLLNWTREFFERNQVEDPRLAAEVLLAHCLDCRRIELYTRFEYQPTEDERNAFRELVDRARRHEPVAYLVGRKEFYSLMMKVGPDVLIPRPETEALVDEARAALSTLPGPGRVWDVCTGSGCVAVAIAHQVPTASVLATDISEAALVVAHENAQLHGVQERVRVRCADKLTVPEDCTDLVPVDVITANPPYVAEGDEIAECVRHEPAVALWAEDNGLAVVNAIIDTAPALLVPGGVLVMEFGCTQADDVRDRVLATDAFDEPAIHCDRQGLERILVARRL